MKLSNKEVESIISSWIDRISKKREDLNGWSICPFASKNIYWEIIILDNLNFENISKICKKYKKEIIIFTSGNEEPTFNILESISIKLNQSFPNLLFLPDHVLNKTYIKNIETGNQHISLIIMQNKKKLLHARALLEKTDYYSFWSDEYIKEIKKYGN